MYTSISRVELLGKGIWVSTECCSFSFYHSDKITIAKTLRRFLPLKLICSSIHNEIYPDLRGNDSKIEGKLWWNAWGRCLYKNCTFPYSIQKSYFLSKSLNMVTLTNTWFNTLRLSSIPEFWSPTHTRFGSMKGGDRICNRPLFNSNKDAINWKKTNIKKAINEKVP